MASVARVAFSNFFFFGDRPIFFLIGLLSLARLDLNFDLEILAEKIGQSAPKL